MDQSQENIVEPRAFWWWLRYLFRVCCYADPRVANSHELDLLDVIAERDAEIVSLSEEIAAMKAEHAEAVAVLNQDIENERVEVAKLQSEVTMLKHDIDLSNELFQKTMNKVRAESAAWAAKIPPEANGTS